MVAVYFVEQEASLPRRALRQVRSMHCGRQCLAKYVQTSTKRGEDAVAVARLESAVGQG